PLLAGLSAKEIEALAALGTTRTYRHGEKIIASGEPATSLFFLRSGVVHVTLPDGVRLATLSAGMAFGEMALLESHRSADVFADASAIAVEIPLADFERFRDQHPRAGERIMRNLAQILAERLIVANTKVNLLTANYRSQPARCHSITTNQGTRRARACSIAWPDTGSGSEKNCRMRPASRNAVI